MGMRGFISRLRRRTSLGRWRKKEKKKNEEKEEPSNSDRNGKPAPNSTSKAGTAADISNHQLSKPQTPDKEPERDSTVKNSDGEESEIIVDDMIPRVLPWQDDASRGGLVLDNVDHQQQSQGLALVPSTIDVGFDDVSAISLEGCLRAEEEKDQSARANETKQSALAENPKKQDEASPSGIVMPLTKEVNGSNPHQKGEGQEATAIEVILPGGDEQRQEEPPPGERSSLKMDPTGRDCTSGAGAEEILASLQQQEQRRSIHRHPLYPQQDVRHQNHLPYIPHHLLPQQQQPGTPRQKNKLLKYQQSNSKVAEMKKHIKGYFRYVPRGEEDNDVSVISI